MRDLRNRQRGFGTLIMLAIYAALAATVIGAVALMWSEYVADPYREEGANAKAAELQPKIVGLEKTVTDQLRINKDLQADVADLKIRVDNQNAAILKRDKRIKQLTAQNTSLIEEARAVLAAGAAEVDRLTAIAVGGPVTNACAEADKIAADLIQWLQANP